MQPLTPVEDIFELLVIYPILNRNVSQMQEFRERLCMQDSYAGKPGIVMEFRIIR